jgi:hypothetical protein
MKISLMIILLLFGTLQSQNPTQKVRNALKQKFPSAVNINWQKIPYSDNWKAVFNLRDRKVTASFTKEAEWFESTMEITAHELNEEVKFAIKRDYPKCEILSAIINEGQIITWDLVKIKCGDKIFEVSYDYRGMSFPPRI